VRIFLLASPALDDFWTGVLDPVLSEPRIEIVGACVDAAKPVPILTRLRRELEKGRGAYVLVMAVKLVTRTLTERGVPTVSYLAKRGIPVREVDDLYADDTLAFIRGTRPDCIFRFGFGLIREPVLSLAPKGVISYHHGNIRSYRGQPVAFWELLAGEAEMSVTVQVLSEQLDAGKIVVEKPVPIEPTDTWRALERRAFSVSQGMIREACLLLARSDFEPEVVPEEELGELYTTPNFRQWATLQARVLMRCLRAARAAASRPAAVKR